MPCNCDYITRTVILPLLKLEAFWFKLHYQQLSKYGKLCYLHMLQHLPQSQNLLHFITYLMNSTVPALVLILNSFTAMCNRNQSLKIITFQFLHYNPTLIPAKQKYVKFHNTASWSSKSDWQALATHTGYVCTGCCEAAPQEFWTSVTILRHLLLNLWLYCMKSSSSSSSSLPWLRFFRAFPSAVRQMPGYN